MAVTTVLVMLALLGWVLCGWFTVWMVDHFEPGIWDDEFTSVLICWPVLVFRACIMLIEHPTVAQFIRATLPSRRAVALPDEYELAARREVDEMLSTC